MGEQNSQWENLRVAYEVARLGTLSAAARVLGMHHATVIRRIDALEAALGCKLFQRHARGYMPTEAGEDLLKVGGEMSQLVAAMTARLQGQGETVSGDLTITTLSGFSTWLTPMLAEFQALYPELRLTLVFDERMLRLEHGEAHLAIRAGVRPEDPDNVVRKLFSVDLAMFAHESYVARHGMLADKPLEEHRFLCGVGPSVRAPTYSWVLENVPTGSIVFRASDARSLEDALAAGIGIGFRALGEMADMDGLVQLSPPRPEWRVDLWLVSHRDLHRTAKVRTLSRFLTERCREFLELDAGRQSPGG